MPLYEYECTKCGERTEAIQRHGDALLTVCPSCGGALVKLLSAPAFQFKGSGFYVTDYGKGGSKAGERTGEKTGEKEKSSSKGEEGKPSQARRAAARRRVAALRILRRVRRKGMAVAPQTRQRPRPPVSPLPRLPRKLRNPRATRNSADAASQRLGPFSVPR